MSSSVTPLGNENRSLFAANRSAPSGVSSGMRLLVALVVLWTAASDAYACPDACDIYREPSAFERFITDDSAVCALLLLVFAVVYRCRDRPADRA